MSRVNGLLDSERGTRWFFGKPYFWHHDGHRLVLLAGQCPSEAKPVLSTKAIAGPTKESA